MWIYICRKKFLSKYEADFAIMNEGCKTPLWTGSIALKALMHFLEFNSIQNKIVFFTRIKIYLRKWLIGRDNIKRYMYIWN